MTSHEVENSYYVRKTANINSQKRQSPLTVVVIGHRRFKTANIIEGGEGEGEKIWKDLDVAQRN